MLKNFLLRAWRKFRSDPVLKKFLLEQQLNNESIKQQMSVVIFEISKLQRMQQQLGELTEGFSKKNFPNGVMPTWE